MSSYLNDDTRTGKNDMLTNISLGRFADKSNWICRNCNHIQIINSVWGFCKYKEINNPTFKIIGGNISLKVKLNNFCESYNL